MRKTHLPDAFTALIIGLTLALLCIIVSLLVTGCVSVTMLDAGGRDTSINFYGYKSSDNDLHATPEIEGGGTVRDAFKDLLRGLPLGGAGLAGILEQAGNAAGQPPNAEPAPIAEAVPDAEPVPEPQAWRSEPLDVALPAGAWAVRYEVRGLVANPGSPPGRSDAEHVFGDLRGDGFERVMLMNMDGPRELRAYLEGVAGEGVEINHERPADGTARITVEMAGGRLLVSINGEPWINQPLDGQPRTLTVGGGHDRSRTFSGEWRGLQAILTGAGQ